jgi:hypothetical protein
VLPSCVVVCTVVWHWLVLWIYVTSNVRFLRSNILHFVGVHSRVMFMYLPKSHCITIVYGVQKTPLLEIRLCLDVNVALKFVFRLLMCHNSYI